ncbi:MAG: transposase [Thermodesulfobacteriota bacterium]
MCTCFQRFVMLCAGRSGQLLNLSSLAADCGITHNTAKAWISVLEANYVMSRTALDGFPFGDVDKDQVVAIIKRLSRIYFADILGYCIMGNHFHLLVRMHPADHVGDDEVKKRYTLYYGDDKNFIEDHIPLLRNKWSSLSEFIREIKQTFSRYYNRYHGRRGTLWGERFKSLIVENGETLINCLAYIDLNPMRAGLVERPEDYRWCSLAYHIQAGNKDGFLSLDFGLAEFGETDAAERLRLYRRYVYEAGGLKKPGKTGAIRREIVEKERDNNFQMDRMRRFLYRTRYFTDAGVIGSKEFVSAHYLRFKHVFISKKEKPPRPVSGLAFYSLKRFSEG